MITIEMLHRRVGGLRTDDLQRWIENAWVRPEGAPGGYLFHDIDVARVRLIVELRYELRVDEETLPIVLSLLDQLHETRRQMLAVRSALDQVAPDDVRHRILECLRAAAAD